VDAKQFTNKTEPSRLGADGGASAISLNANSSLRVATGAFETHMQQEGLSENTVKAFLSDLRILTRFLGAGTSIVNISTNDIDLFVDWLKKGRHVPCSPKSLARRVTTLRVFFRWLVGEGVLHKNPAQVALRKPVKSALPTILSDAEIDAVSRVTQSLRRGEEPDARPYLLFTLLLYTSIKKSECMNIVLNHVDTSDPEQPFLWIRYSNPRRRAKERRLRLPVWWPAALSEYCAQYQIADALFPCTARNLEYVLHKVAQLAGISHNLSFETLRWTCAVRDHRDGMADEMLRQKLGISKITWRNARLKIWRLANPSL